MTDQSLRSIADDLVSALKQRKRIRERITENQEQEAEESREIMRLAALLMPSLDPDGETIIIGYGQDDTAVEIWGEGALCFAELSERRHIRSIKDPEPATPAVETIETAFGEIPVGAAAGEESTERGNARERARVAALEENTEAL